MMTHASSLLAVTWIASLWQGASMALLAVACLRMMPRAGAAVRHLILVAVFAFSLVLPLIPVHSKSQLVEHAGIALVPWIASTIALAWLTASAVRATGLVHAWLHLRRVRASATPIAVEDINGFSIGNRYAALCSSDEVDTPAVLGFFRPVLLLPTWLVPTLTPEDLRALALHECEHLRRRDDWTNLLLQLGLVIMPLNLALLWLNRRIATERELACDAAVVDVTKSPLAYAASLTRLAEQRIHHHTVRLALAALGRESELSQRVHALLRESAAPWSRGQSIAAVSASAVLLITTATGLVHAPQFVRVAEPVAEVAAVQRSVPAIRSKSADMTMLPVSYEIKPAAKRAHRSTKAVARSVQTVTQTVPQPLHFVRTAYAADGVPMRYAVERDDRSARPVNPELIPNYVAVPVANGWLLIEL